MDSFAGKMIIAICHCLKESAQTKRLATWLAELGPYPNHRLLVGRDSRAEPNLFANSGFGSVEEITIIGDVWNHWPESCCNAFRQIGKHIEFTTKQPWLWLEVDAIPLKSGWPDLIEAEYRACGKPFLGDFVHVPEMMNVPDHCSGVAVYPGILSHYAGDAYLAHELAWDVVAAAQIVPRMHKSKYILHRWKHVAFETWEQVQQAIFDVKPEAALFHADKAGSLIGLLRGKLSGGVVGDTRRTSKEDAQPERESARIRPAQPFCCDLLIKSHPPDYARLDYCIRSIAKFASGFRRVVLIVPKGSAMPWGIIAGLHVVEVEESGDGYLFQNAVKASAHDYTNADYILHIDSDTILTKPVTPETFMRDGMPLWLITPYAELKRDIEQISMGNAGFTCGVMEWQRITEAFLGQPVEYEFMRRFPMLVPRWLHVAAAAFCTSKHGRTLTDYIMSRPAHEFSEFNALGALAYYHHRDKITWLDTTKEPLPEPVAIQKWSHDLFTDETKAEFEEILKGESHDGNILHNNAGTVGSDNWIRDRLRGTRIVDQSKAVGADNANIRQTKEDIWILANDSHISRWVEEKGSLQHDYETLPQILAEIPVGGTVVDVGAFIGDYAGPFLERVGLDGEVFAYEPNMDAWECLKRNCPKAHCLPYALGDDLNAPLLELAPSGNAGARYLRKFGWEKEQGHAVQIATLDSDTEKLERCDLVHVDVEGFELHVLRGAEQTINRFHPKLVLEINEGALARQGSSAEEISDWLFKHGYKWRPLQSDITAASPQYDILCTWIQPAVSDLTCAVPEIDRVKWWIDQTTGRKVVWDGTQWVPATPSSCEKAGVDWNQFEKDARFTNPTANDSRESIVRDTVAILKALCTAPRYVSQVRKELKAQGVIR